MTGPPARPTSRRARPAPNRAGRRGGAPRGIGQLIAQASAPSRRNAPSAARRSDGSDVAHAPYAARRSRPSARRAGRGAAARDGARSPARAGDEGRRSWPPRHGRSRPRQPRDRGKPHVAQLVAEGPQGRLLDLRRTRSQIAEAVERHLPLRAVARSQEPLERLDHPRPLRHAAEDLGGRPAEIAVVTAECLEHHGQRLERRIAQAREGERGAPALACQRRPEGHPEYGSHVDALRRERRAGIRRRALDRLPGGRGTRRASAHPGRRASAPRSRRSPPSARRDPPNAAGRRASSGRPRTMASVMVRPGPMPRTSAMRVGEHLRDDATIASLRGQSRSAL